MVRRLRALVVVLAVAATAALALPWPTSAPVVHVIDGPTATPTSPDGMTGFAHLGWFRYIAVLVIAGAVLVTFVPAVRPSLRSTPGLVVIAVLVVVAGAMATNPVWTPGVEDERWHPVDQVATGDFGAVPRLVPTDDGVAVVTDSDVSEVIDVENGEPVVLARTADRDVTVLGIVHGRLVYHRADVWEVRVVHLDEPARPSVVTGVLSADSMSAFGILLFRTTEASAPVLRRLDINDLAEGSTTSFTDVEALPLPSTRALAETDDPARPMRFVEHPRTGQVVALDNTELGMGILMSATPDAQDWQEITKRRNCGPPHPGFDEVAPDQQGGWWLLDSPGVLRHMTADGDEHEVQLPFPDTGPLTMAVDHLGVPYFVDRDGLWRLSSITQGELLPVNGAHCPPPAADVGPVRLDTVDRGPEAVPLDVSGRRWVRVDGDRAELVTPEGRRELPGTPQAGRSVLPDGSGGLWLLDSTNTWSHLNASGKVLARHPGSDPLAPRPSDKQPLVVVDLSGGVPTMANCQARCWQDVVIGRDGRAWLAADRLFSSGPGAAPVPVADWLVDGVSVPVVEPTLGLDEAGRPLILANNVLFGLTETNQLTMLGQDERLWGARLVPVEGGTLVRTSDGRLHRLDY